MGQLEHARIQPYGVNRDLSAVASGPAQWQEAIGVSFRRDRTERAAPYETHATAPLFAPERLLYRNYNGVNQWFYAGPIGIGVCAANASYDVSPVGFGPVSSARQTWSALNSIPIYNHPETVPLYHAGDPNTAMVALPGWPAGWSCASMRAFSFYLLALDVTDATARYENQVRWSSSADPGNIPAEWTPSATNDAGDLTLSSEPGAIVDGLAMRDKFIVYKASSCYSLRVIGGVFVFRQRKLFNSLGMLARDCAAEWEGRHFLVSEGDIVVHDGVNVQSVADKVVREAIFSDMSSVYWQRCFVFHDVAEKQMVFYWPSAVSTGWCDRKAAYNYGDGRWTLEAVELPVGHAGVGAYTLSGTGETWAEPTGVVWSADHGAWNEGEERAAADQVLVGWPDTTKLGERRGRGSPNNLPVDSRLSLLYQDLERPQQLKLVDRFWLEGGSAGPVEWSVQVGASDSPSAPIAWQAPQTVTMVPDSPNVAVGGQVKGRYLSLKLGCTTPYDWHLDGVSADFRQSGRF